MDAATCQALDDDFFRSDPTAYFRSKIEMLSHWSVVSDDAACTKGSPCDGSISVTEVDNLASPPTSRADRQRQVVADAVQLRHQAAEALQRILHAETTRTSSAKLCSLWAALEATPRQLGELVTFVGKHLRAEGAAGWLAGLIVPAPYGTELGPRDVSAVEHAAAWIMRASELVSTGHIDLNAASNKIKHGVAARSEDSLRIGFVQGPVPEGDRLALPALSSGGAVDIVDGPVLEFISRPPKATGQEANGLERTWLRADVPVILAETWLIALLYGAVFGTSAYRSYEGEPPVSAAMHPGLATGPAPHQLVGRSVIVGIREPLTTTRSGTIQRPLGLQLGDGAFIEMTVGQPTRVIIVDERS